MLARVLENTGATMRDRGAMYKSATQSVLPYVSEIWVGTGKMHKVLEGFHHRAALRITGMTANHGTGGEREHPPVVEAMESMGIHPIGDYIMRQQ